MRTKIKHIRKLYKEIPEIVEELRAGKLIIMPTDTIYGFIADAMNESSAERIFEVKQRDKDKKFLILVASIDDFVNYADNENYKYYSELIKKIYKKPVTFVLKAKSGLPEHIVKEGNIAIRVPGKAYLRELSAGLGRPLIAPSANISGKKDIRFFFDIIKLFKNKVDYIYYKFFIMDLTPSTILDLTGNKPEIVRQGKYIIGTEK